MLDFMYNLDRNLEVNTKLCDNFDDCMRAKTYEDGNGLGIIHFNIRSLQKHYDELLVYVETAHLIADVIVLSETGWDCSDDSLATPFYMLVIELLLLVLSNLAFIPAVYVAFKRKYYVESIAYFSICFFSIFYHSCDAGENIISFCITKPNALQFGDFFCALLAIWVTLLAMADLPQMWTSIAQMAGAISLAFCTSIDRMALWVFIVPVVIGIFIVLGS
ncbi:unnamed protein product [Callosobruchus maculatus]|uniref:Uncharacterized protein n=1 Tax=Callosobruchus maculatus TaxID=64391 RepID=A0A653CAB0_CALMS|nr:unnamed protein product [Callosobruchus maculatus]